jgi:hypothetical protein
VVAATLTRMASSASRGVHGLGISLRAPRGRVGAAMHPLLPEPEMAQDALDDILLVDERNDAHFP